MCSTPVARPITPRRHIRRARAGVVRFRPHTKRGGNRPWDFRAVPVPCLPKTRWATVDSVKQDECVCVCVSEETEMQAGLSYGAPVPRKNVLSARLGGTSTSVSTPCLPEALHRGIRRVLHQAERSFTAAPLPPPLLTTTTKALTIRTSCKGMS